LLPLIKLKLYDVEFDILMCQISDKILSTNFDFDSEILDLIDERERKFINGCRMAAYL
jgi:poly(A) polymerase Pap1